MSQWMESESVVVKMDKEYIPKDAANKWICETCDCCEGTFCVPCDGNPLKDIPAADVEPVRHAYWVKRMEYGVGRGYEVYTPIWSCSDCGRDYDPASCSIIKYCYICGAKMDGGQDDG